MEIEENIMNGYPVELLKSKTFWTAVLTIAGLWVSFGLGQITIDLAIGGTVLAFQSINLKSGQVTLEVDVKKAVQ